MVYGNEDSDKTRWSIPPADMLATTTMSEDDDFIVEGTYELAAAIIYDEVSMEIRFHGDRELAR